MKKNTTTSLENDIQENPMESTKKLSELINEYKITGYKTNTQKIYCISTY